jgi:polyisoprenyl-phosphate glycosyltransferase
VVVPCYNEEDVLPETLDRLGATLHELIADRLVADDSSLLLVDDGSTDRTWQLVAAAQDQDPRVGGLKLAANVGHQRALLAGLLRARSSADCVISIDADLQDDLAAMREMVQRHHEGFEVVYGVRRQREVDTFFKRSTALAFYRLMGIMGVDVVHNHADYRLLGRRALEGLAAFDEVNLFLRGIVPLIGFRSTEVYYDRHERFAGESKYPLRKMLAFAIDGITSFSVTPIRWVTATGFAFCLFSIAAAVYGLASKALGLAVPGWTSLILSVWFIGGVQLISLGLIGEYVGKIYQETKRRPKFLIDVWLPARATEQPSAGAAAGGTGRVAEAGGGLHPVDGSRSAGN